MILVDRPLSTVEISKIDGENVVDITSVQPQRNSIKNEVFEWIDTAENVNVNDESPIDYFSIDGDSYWLHIRARIFFELYNDAQILDRIPDLSLLSKIDKVYCDQSQKSFWNRWTPSAEKIFSEYENYINPKTEPIFNRILYAFRYKKTVEQLLSQNWEGVVYSGMLGTALSNGKLIDKKMRPLYNKFEKPIIRFEYQTVPKYNPKSVRTSFFDNPRNTPTLPTDVLFLIYAARHPFKLVRTIKNSYMSVRKDDRLAFDFQFKVQNLIWHQHISDMWKKFRMSLVQFHVFREIFRWTLEEIQPKFVLATAESNNIGRTFIEEAKKLNIQTFGIQHGDISPHNIDYRYSKKLAPKAFPDYFFSWGENSKDYLVVQSHQDSKRIFPVGQLEFDEIYNTIRSDELILEFRKKRKKPVVFFGSQQQQNQKSRVETARVLAEFCKQNKLCCAVKLHPRENRDDIHKSMFEKAGIEDDFLIVDCNVYSGIMASDYSATCYSTIAWEAMSLRKPLIIIDPLELNLLGLREVASVLYVVDTDNEFDKWNKNLENHIELNFQISSEKLGLRDGKTAERIVSTINKLVFEE